ncbi:MAG: aminoglycoside 6'-N-acetyltransferase [Anaerolineae bacterium]
MHIRSVQPEDRDEWLRLRAALWPDCTRETHQADMAETMAEPGKWGVFVAVRADSECHVGHPGELAGFIEVSLQPYAAGCDTSPVGYIEGWYVDTDRRRGGLGRQLVAAAEAWAAEHGCREMASDCDIDNAGSLAAHEALGYEEVQRVVQLRKRLG